MARRSWILSLVALLAGCAGSGVANIEGSHRPAEGNGVLVVSVTASGYLPGSLWYQVVRSSNISAKPVSIPVNDDSFGVDWRSGSSEVKNGGTGRLAVIELPQGDYELRRWVINSGNRAAYISRKPFGYRFTIQPGKTTYIGNVHVDIQHSASSSLPYAISLEDKRERDLLLLRRKYSGIRQDSVTVAIADEAAAEQRTQDRPGARSTRRIDDLKDLLPGK